MLLLPGQEFKPWKASQVHKHQHLPTLSWSNLLYHHLSHKTWGYNFRNKVLLKLLHLKNYIVESNSFKEWYYFHLLKIPLTCTTPHHRMPKRSKKYINTQTEIEYAIRWPGQKYLPNLWELTGPRNSVVCESRFLVFDIILIWSNSINLTQTWKLPTCEKGLWKSTYHGAMYDE